MATSPLFVRARPGRSRCSQSDAWLGPLFTNSKCKAPGDWEHFHEANKQHGRICTAHMLDRLEDRRRQHIGVDGFAAERPTLCGGLVWCRDWQVCQVECASACCAKARCDEEQEAATA